MASVLASAVETWPERAAGGKGECSERRGVLGKSAVDRFTTRAPTADALGFFLQIVRRKQTAKAVLTLLKQKSLPSRPCHPPVLLCDWA